MSNINSMGTLNGAKGGAGNKPVIAGVASMPSRTDSLEEAIHSIYWQVDEVYVYLNNFDTVPDYLNLPRIRTFRSQEHGDLKDVGKFFALTMINDGILFTVDDDIIYPPDYVRTLLDHLEALEFGAAVGVHGVVLPENPKSFFDRKAFPFWRKLETPVPVSFLGTGTCAFDIGRINLPFSAFTSYGMADLHLGVFLKNKGIPAVAVARNDNWLVGNEDDLPEDGDTLYEQTRIDSRPHNEIIRSARPWGEKDIIARWHPVSDSRIFGNEVKFALKVLSGINIAAGGGGGLLSKLGGIAT